MYQIYFLIKGTSAIKIFSGIAFLYLIWILVQALDMKLLSSILGHIMGVGVIALLIVFQQEIRKFFAYLSSGYLKRIDESLVVFLARFGIVQGTADFTPVITEAAKALSETKTGALMVLVKDSELLNIIETGVKIDAELSSELLRNLFFKNSPLHDGAVVIKNERIVSAGCILPISDRFTHISSDKIGLRHRAAMGITEQTDCVVVVVSEETGQISLFYDNKAFRNVSPELLQERLYNLFKISRKRKAKSPK